MRRRSRPEPPSLSQLKRLEWELGQEQQLSRELYVDLHKARREQDATAVAEAEKAIASSKARREAIRRDIAAQKGA